MTGKVNLLMLVDMGLIGTKMHSNMELALARLSEEVSRLSEDRLGLSWRIKYHEYRLEDIDWRLSSYKGTDGKVRSMYIPKSYWVSQLNDTFDEENTSVQLIIAPENWKDPDFIIGGINYFQTQVLNPAASWSVSSWKITIEHELMHSFDNRGVAFDVDFSNAIGKNRKGDVVRNWDYDVVHETYAGSKQQINKFDYVWDQLVDEISIIYPNTMQNITIEKLVQITNELLLRDPIAGEDVAYVGRPEDDVRAEIGSLSERWKIVDLVNSARNIKPL